MGFAITWKSGKLIDASVNTLSQSWTVFAHFLLGQFEARNTSALTLGTSLFPFVSVEQIASPTSDGHLACC
jgi:hypothetical protein